MRGHWLVALLATSTILGGEALGDVTISGTQTRGLGTDGKLRCTAVGLPKGGTIIQVLGAEAGFWLESDAAQVLRFDRADGALGVPLPAGSWCAYPNLYQGKVEASVAVVVRPEGTAPPTLEPTPLDAAQSIVGTWRRSDGPEVYTFAPDGSASADTGTSGRWRRMGRRRFEVSWTHRPPGGTSNCVDTLAVSPDGKSFSGANNYGNAVTATRLASVADPGASIVGTWARTDGPEVYTFHADGRATANTGTSGRWTRTGANSFQARWTHRPPGGSSNFVDDLTVSADGRSFSGANNYGNRVNAVRR